MNVKRSLSSTSSVTPPSSPSFESLITPLPKKAKGGNAQSKKTPSSAKSTQVSPGSEGQINGSWNPEKKALMMDRIIALGYKAANLDELAAELGVNKRQIINQLTTGKNNLRSKIVDQLRKEAL